ncbi:MAG: Hsp20 family protein [Pseudonocardiaceae bacterium]|nr:Hsp20 family protein [Pseudonocardiaceae bacterium]
MTEVMTVLLNYDPAFDPFKMLERLSDQQRERAWTGMPMDVYRAEDHFVANFDLPGVDPGSIDVTVEGNTLTVKAERSAPTPDTAAEWLVAERLRGRYGRQLMLGRDLDADNLHASYHDGVLTLTIPVVEKVKPRRVEISHSGAPHTIEGGPKVAADPAATG